MKKLFLGGPKFGEVSRRIAISEKKSVVLSSSWAIESLLGNRVFIVKNKVFLTFCNLEPCKFHKMYMLEDIEILLV